VSVNVLQSFFFAVRCNQVKHGPQRLSFSYSRPDTYQDENFTARVSIETSIDIDAQAGYIEKRQTAYEPPRSFPVMKELTETISAETILNYAEAAGGQEYHKIESNQCLIRGVRLGNEWEVYYTVDAFDSVRELKEELSIWFDATTGEVTKTDQPVFVSSTSTP
jgi:hypothetical protein